MGANENEIFYQLRFERNYNSILFFFLLLIFFFVLLMIVD